MSLTERKNKYKKPPGLLLKDDNLSNIANLEASLLRECKESPINGRQELDSVYKMTRSQLASPQTAQRRTNSNRSTNSIRTANLIIANKRSDSARHNSRRSKPLDEEVPTEKHGSLNSTQEFITQAMLHNDSINNEPMSQNNST